MPSALAQAIAQAEGFGAPNAIPTVANNPGDLKVGDVGYGTAAGGITIFGSVDEGWARLDSQLAAIASGGSSYYNPGMSLAQIGNIYAGGDANWAINVARALHVTPDTTFADAYQGGSPVSLASPTAILDTAASAVETGLDEATNSTFLESLGPMGLAFAGIGVALFLVLVLD